MIFDKEIWSPVRHYAKLSRGTLLNRSKNSRSNPIFSTHFFDLDSRISMPKERGYGGEMRGSHHSRSCG